jgi:hypothetical protein
MDATARRIPIIRTANKRVEERLVAQSRATQRHADKIVAVTVRSLAARIIVFKNVPGLDVFFRAVETSIPANRFARRATVNLTALRDAASTNARPPGLVLLTKSEIAEVRIWTQNATTDITVSVNRLVKHAYMEDRI